MLSVVFKNVPEKRFVIKIENVLHYAQTASDKAAIYQLYAFHKPDKAINYLQHIYASNPNNDALNFLLLREVNKVEDWILTPYYTQFMPSSTYDYWEGNNKYSTQYVFDRVKDDRQYAQQLLEFINTVNLTTVSDPSLWIMAKAYMQTLTQQFASSTETLNTLNNKVNDPKIINQINLIKCLNAFSTKDTSNVGIPSGAHHFAKSKKCTMAICFKQRA